MAYWGESRCSCPALYIQKERHYQKRSSSKVSNRLFTCWHMHRCCAKYRLELHLLTHSTRKPPNTLPLVGNGLLFLQAREKLFAWFVKCERIFGHETFELYVPSLPPGVVINDPRNLDYVFKNEAIFAKGEFMKKPLWDLFGECFGLAHTAAEQS